MRILAVIFVGAILYFAVNTNLKQNFIKPNFITPLAQIGTFINPKPSPTTDRSLQSVVEEALKRTKGTYGIVIKNLKTGESYSAREHQEFPAGSLYKVWVMAEALNQIQDGNLDEKEILSEEVSALNNEFNIDPESAGLTQGVITLSVKDAIQQMIIISHNYAALLLSKRIGLSNVIDFLKHYRFNESILGESPKTTPSDIARFFEKLYQGELADQENTQKMIDILKRQSLNDKIPKYLPKEITVAHKTGEIDFFTHDAGIVFTNKGDYIIVILSESDSPYGAKERISNVSKAVYEYFQRD